MKKGKTFSSLAALATAMFIATGCTTTSNNDSANSSNTESNTESTSTISASDVLNKYSDEDLDTSWEESSATNITLEGSSITVDGSGAKADGGVLTVTEAGTYVLSGSLTEGQVVIDAGDEDTVRLVLNGANITNPTGAPIYASNADDLIITLADGTENTVTDGGDNFTYASTEDEEPDAALFSKCDLTINGTGTFTVNAGFNNGIGTKDDLVIAGGNFIIKAKNHGIRGRDSVTVVDGNFDITAGNDGIQSNNEDPEQGWISLEDGTYDITSANDGIQSENIIVISGGEYTIKTGGATSKSDTSDSYKGLKAGSDMTISDGNFSIDSADDSVHSNGNIAISDGDFTLTSGDDGIHADADLSVSGGTINVKESYEGLEGATINISGGTIDIVASDDGINAAGGSNSSSEGDGKFGPDSFSSSGEYYINVTGGEISLVAGGDGFDSNGDITISGGEVVSLIKSTPDNEAMDCDGTLTFTGGTIIYGGTGVGNVPGDESTQSYVYTDSGVSSGKEVSVQSDGKTLISFTPEIDCQYLAFSSPDITSDESYDVYSGSSLLATVIAGTGGNTGMIGGQGGPGGKGGPGGQRNNSDNQPQGGPDTESE